MIRVVIVAVAVMLIGGSNVIGADGPASAPATLPTLTEQIAQLRALQEVVRTRLLAVPEEDKKRLAEFLKLPDSGLIKLLPREKYDLVVGIRGGGAYYSFVRLTHEYGHGSDIELQNRRLSCGFAGGDYGYFLQLGDVPIEKAASVVPEKPPEWARGEAAERWTEFWSDVPVDFREVRERKMNAGRNLDGEKEWGASAKAGNTYLLRSVSPDRSDILVALRVERAFDEEGSILLSWKLLKKFPVANPRGRALPPFNPNRGVAPQAK